MKACEGGLTKMADSDKDILITPNTGVASTHPKITFTGKDNSPIDLKILDDNTLSFEGVQGQVFSMSPILNSGDIFSVNDISGVQSMAISADGTITMNAQTKSVTITNSASDTSTLILENTNADEVDGPILELYRNTASPADGGDAGTLLFTGQDNAGNKQEYGRITMEFDDVVSGTEEGELIFRLTEAGSVEQEYMRLRGSTRQIEFNTGRDDIDMTWNGSGSGNDNVFYCDAGTSRIGIGTASPASKLHVTGTMQVGVDDTGHDVKFFGATSGAYMEWDESANQLNITGATYDTSIVDGVISLGAIGNISGANSSTLSINSAGSVLIHLDTNGNDTDSVFRIREDNTDFFYMDNDGNVGIGNTSPDAKLDVDEVADGIGLRVRRNDASTTVPLVKFIDDSTGNDGPTVLEIQNDVTDGLQPSLMITGGSISIKEQANAPGDTAAYGQIWVNTATPNELYFTTDAGNDIQLTSGTGVAGGGGGASALNDLTDVISDITNFTDSILISPDGAAPPHGTLNGATGNVGIGKDVFSALTSGEYNVAIGDTAGAALTTGDRNILIGFDAGDSILGGNNNICIGPDAGQNITSGEYNVMIGGANADSATGDKQLSITSGDGGGTNWIKGNSDGVVLGALTPMFYERSGMDSGTLDFRVPIALDGDAGPNGYPMPYAGVVQAVTFLFTGGSITSDSSSHTFRLRKNSAGSGTDFSWTSSSLTNVATNVYTKVVTSGVGLTFSAGDVLQIKRTVSGATLNNAQAIVWVKLNSF
jgi:hypothetical protein